MTFGKYLHFTAWAVVVFIWISTVMGLIGCPYMVGVFIGILGIPLGGYGLFRWVEVIFKTKKKRRARR